MKKTLLLLLIGISTISIHAQETNTTNNPHFYYSGVENSNSLKLTTEQRNRIIKIKKEAGPKFAAIGRDHSLSGYEKGQKKKALSLQIKKDIQNVLSEDQSIKWGNYRKDLPIDYLEKEAKIEAIENKIDSLEAEYKAFEDNDYISKAEKKAKKTAYKTEKDKLKAEKKAIKKQYRY